MKGLSTIFLLVCAMNLTIASSAQPAEALGPRQFTLVCRSSKLPPPANPAWVVDVNLDNMSVYVDGQFGGLDEIHSDDGRLLTFFRWGRDMHGVPWAKVEAFDRADGHWYFSPRSDGALIPPDAICAMSAPRENFKANEKFVRPEL